MKKMTKFGIAISMVLVLISMSLVPAFAAEPVTAEIAVKVDGVPGTVTIEAVTEGAPMPEQAVLEDVEEGSFVIEFSEAGEYSYKVSQTVAEADVEEEDDAEVETEDEVEAVAEDETTEETADETTDETEAEDETEDEAEAVVTYDETVYEVTVSVVAGEDDVLTATVVVRVEGSEDEVEAIEFKNVSTTSDETSSEDETSSDVTTSDEESSDESVPETGDSSVILWFALAGLSLAAIAAVAVTSRRKFN